LPGPSKHPKFNGETNLYFQGDEVSFEESTEEIRLDANGHPSSISNGDCAKSILSEPEDLERVSVGEEAEFSLSQGFYKFLSTVFLQLSKTKQLRVIHIKSKANSGDPLVDDVDGVPPDQSSSEDEDEDYWFTKWSRRPKLKNSFKPNAKTMKATRHDVGFQELNSRTTLNYEEIKNLEGEKEDESAPGVIRHRKTSGSPTFPSDKDCSPPPPSSPTRRRNSFELNRHSKPSDNYETEWPSEDEFQQDLDPSGDGQDGPQEPHEGSPSAFTNFGFHLEPEDSGLTGHESEIHERKEEFQSKGESHKTATEVHLGTMSTPPPPITNPSDTSQEPIKSNGFVRSMSSPPRSDTFEPNGHVSPTEIPEASETEVIPAPDNSKPLLFFIHGISGSSDIWKSQFKFFHELGYEIVAPDILGHGMSSTPDKAKHYLFESLVQDLVAVFDHFAGESRISVIIGHGYG